MSILRGLLALTFITLCHTTLSAKYLYKDDVVQNPKFSENIEILGKELYDKTGVSLKLVMTRDLPNQTDILTYQKNIIQEFNEPMILLTFAELNSEIDILASDASLYKHFNRDQVLSPVASMAQAIAMGVLFAKSFDNFVEFVKNSGGSILPLLGSKSKDGMTTDKYAAALFNGYVDIAGQVATSYGVELESVNGQGRNYVLTTIKIIFYGIILMALVMYIRKKIYERRLKRGNN